MSSGRPGGGPGLWTTRRVQPKSGMHKQEGSHVSKRKTTDGSVFTKAKLKDVIGIHLLFTFGGELADSL